MTRAPTLILTRVGQVDGHEEVAPTEGAGSIIGAEKGAAVRILEAKIVKRCNKDSLITSNAAGKYPLGFPLGSSWKNPGGKPVQEDGGSQAKHRGRAGP